MSLLEIDFIDADEVFIKDELDPNEEIYAASDSIPDEIEIYNEKCGEIFASDEGNFILICASCEKQYTSLKEFGKHFREEHLNVDPDSSQNDQIESIDLNASAIEVLSELQTCLAETLDSNDNSTFVNTDDSKADPSVDEFQCEVCNRKYKTKQTLKRHKLCHDKLLDNNDAISDKAPKQSQVDPKRKHCKYCGKQFSGQVKCLEHERVHTGERPFQCDHCPKSFRVLPQLNSHLNVHTGARPYECTFCSKSFKNHENLMTHKRIHLGIKNHACEICGKRFVRNVEKEIHKRTHTGEKPFQCEECGKRFIIGSLLNAHRKRHTNTRDYKCDICCKLFYSRELLQDHQVMHSSDRPFACSVCGRDFPRKKALRTHEKLHSDVKEYICNICGKAFAQCAGLYSHKKSHGTK